MSEEKQHQVPPGMLPQPVSGAVLRLEKQTFRDQTVVLDHHEFVGCTIEGCTLIYFGHGPVRFVDTELVNCSWRFEGPAGAGIALLRNMHAAGGHGRTIAEVAIQDIRGKLKKKA